jgi:hypothetical protein
MSSKFKELEEKLLNNIQLTGTDIHSIIRGDFYPEIKIIEDHMYSNIYSHIYIYEVVFQMEDKFFGIHYYAAATEYQELNYPEQIALRLKKKEATIELYVPLED